MTIFRRALALVLAANIALVGGLSGADARMAFDPNGTGKLFIPGLRQGVASAVASAVPTSDWRLPITAAYDSGGDTAFVTALAASSTGKTLPTLTNNTPIAASTTRDISFKVGAVVAPGAMLYLDWAQSGTGLVSITVFESTDSTDGSAASGAWTQNSFAPWKPSGDTVNTGYSNRGQTPRLAAGPAGRWVRYRIVTPASTTCLPYFGAFQLQPDGSQPLFGGVSMSIVNSNMTSRVMRAAIQALIPGSDPIWINTARAGANGQAIYTEQVQPLQSNPQLAGIQAFYLSEAINDVAYSGIRPIGTNSSADAAVGTNWQQNFDALAGLVGAARVFSPDISFMNFATGDSTAGSAPYVNSDVNSNNGSLPYNRDQIWPRLKVSASKSVNADMGAPYVSDYAGDAAGLEDYYGAGPDPLHNSAAGATAWVERLAPFIAQIYGQPVGDDTMQSLLKQAGNPTTAAFKARLQNLVTAMGTMYPPAAGAQTTNRNAYAATVNGLSTTFADPAVTAPAILPTDSSLSAYTLVARFHAGDPSKFTRDFRGTTSALVDRKNGYTMAQATYNQRPKLRTGIGATKARLDFQLGANLVDGRNGTFLASTDAGLVGSLDAGAVPFTFFMVVTPSIVPPNGSDLFCIGNATFNTLLVGLQANSIVPRVLIGDGTGAAYSLTPTDAALVSAGPNTTYAFAVRRLADGTLKYFRGSVTAAGSTTRNAAVTNTGARIGYRVQGGGVSYTGGEHETLLYQGAMSDAEIGNVLAGLQFAWGAI